MLMPLYATINNYLITHIPEISFIIVTLIYLFFYRYMFLLLEKLVRGISNALFENKPRTLSLIRYADSFIVFIITFILLIPLGKVILEKVLEPYLKTQYLTWIVLTVFIGSYIYYMLIYSKHLHDSKGSN